MPSRIVMFQDKASLKKGIVLSADTLAELHHRLTSGPILPDGTGAPVMIGRSELERLVPHRGAMLLVDSIHEVDRAARRIRGHRRLSPDDAAFAGQFPDDPVYPSPLIVEAIGQLAVALLPFADNWSLDAPEQVMPPRVQTVRIHAATFIMPFVPRDTMVVHSQVIESGETTLVAGQAWRNGALAAFAVLELQVDDVIDRVPRDEQTTEPREVKEQPSSRHRRAFGRLTLEGFLD